MNNSIPGMSSMAEALKEINCKAVGDSGVGKTSLLLAYLKKKFPTEIDLINAKYCCAGLESVTIKDTTCNVELYDTWTNANFSRMRLLGYSGMHVILVCFSVVLPSSVGSLKTVWLPEITQYGSHKSYILVGTQIDLRDDEITVQNLAHNNLKPITFEEGEKLAEELNAFKYIECSVLTQEGLQDLLKEVVLAARAPPKQKKSKKNKKCLIL